MPDRSVHSPTICFMWWSDSGSQRFGLSRSKQYISFRFPWGKSFSIVWRSEEQKAPLARALSEQYYPDWVDDLDAAEEGDDG